MAEEALHQVEIHLACSEHLKPDDRRRMLDRWHNLARGRQQSNVEYDDRGRTVLRGGQSVRDWLRLMGGMTSEVQE